MLFFIANKNMKEKRKKNLRRSIFCLEETKLIHGSFLTFILSNNNVYHLSSAKTSLSCVLSSSQRCICNYRLENVPMVILEKHTNRHFVQLLFALN